MNNNIEGGIPTELTWDEKNPVNYIYRPCEAISRLEARIKKLEAMAKVKGVK